MLSDAALKICAGSQFTDNETETTQSKTPQQPDLEDGEITQLKMLPILSGYLTTKQKMVISRNYYKHYQNCYDDATGELEDNEDSGHEEDGFADDAYDDYGGGEPEWPDSGD